MYVLLCLVDRNVNSEGFKPNTQTQLVPLLATAIKVQDMEAISSFIYYIHSTTHFLVPKVFVCISTIAEPLNYSIGSFIYQVKTLVIDIV